MVQAKQKIHPIVTTQGSYVVAVDVANEPANGHHTRTSQQAIEAGAIHIAAQQCPNGGFGWPHNDCDNTYNNITPPIIDGVRQAYLMDSNLGYLGVMTAAGDYDLTHQYGNAEARFGAFTAYQMWHLSRDTGDDTYHDFTEMEFFAALEAGTYSDADWDTAGWIAAVETARTGTWVNLRPWEFSSLVLIAQRHCRPIQSGSFEQAIWAGLGTLDRTDPDNVYSDVIGVAGGLLGLARINRLNFPAINAPLHDGVNGIDNLADLADYLVSLQNPNGSFYWHSNLAAPDASDQDTQSTAYATLALIAANERMPMPIYSPAIAAAKAYLLTMQDNDGGFASYPGDTEHNTEVEGEVLSALGTIGVYDRLYRSGMECYLY
ncbi:prenyltransferase/squalene oxidase repeat-containing protein [Marinicella meishanensis]|uniref:prenyltransferase/squalene oxidase repeat-containing protein n=1 Tax=Marinicella meishanensis TaxID=2873263 RepID=UPI001CBF9F2E|nr:prenyltransferase/squalene oxidase repeat-containing protein [Marinicella sp. NBU2979]